MGGGGEIMAGREWSWMVARFSNAHYKNILFDLCFDMYFFIKT